MIRNLPHPDEATEIEMIAIMREVIVNLLEWAYGSSDGNYKMYTYAKAALETLNRSYSLSDEEEEELKKSKLYSYIARE